MMRLMGPRVVALGAVQAADLVIIRLASGLPEGGVSAYFYAFLAMYIPVALFGSAFAGVFFPTLAEQAILGDEAGFRRSSAESLRFIWLFVLPSAAGIAMLAQPLVALLLQRGAFDATSVALVAAMLTAFVPRIVADATSEHLTRLFYARKDTRTPMIGYLLWVVIQIGLMWLWREPYGAVGLAAATSVASVLLVVGLWASYRWRFGPVATVELGPSAIRMVASTAAMAGVIWLIGLGGWALLAQVSLSIGAGLGVYFGLFHLLGGRDHVKLAKLLLGRAEDDPAER
jgi:putative peptidoglycan lipid II flippase